MKKEEIKSRELKRILEAKFDVFDFKDIKDSDLDKIMQQIEENLNKKQGSETTEQESNTETTK